MAVMDLGGVVVVVGFPGDRRVTRKSEFPIGVTRKTEFPLGVTRKSELASSGIIHRPVRVHLFPHIIVRP